MQLRLKCTVLQCSWNFRYANQLCYWFWCRSFARLLLYRCVYTAF